MADEIPVIPLNMQKVYGPVIRGTREDLPGDVSRALPPAPENLSKPLRFDPQG